uniref:DNA-directed RNA polymerase subunit n=1 Tax=Pithovirus LCPAC202 TaxID=2506592 RepID=A0A481Z741_9VIRU|nr:MAG: DNA-directed RNA polymerase subunit alpha [Pithovirus LCPAC202]
MDPPIDYSEPNNVPNLLGLQLGSLGDTNARNATNVSFQVFNVPGIVPQEEGNARDCPMKPEIIEMKIKPEDRVISIARNEARNLDRSFQERMAKLPVGVFVGMSFSIFDDDTIEKISAVTVTSADKAGFGTVNDPCFGVISGNQSCPKCANTLSHCPGHIGHIPLQSPYSPEIYLKFIVQVLNSICLGCKHLLLTEDELGKYGLWYLSGKHDSRGERKIWRYHGDDRLKRISELTKKSGLKCSRHLYNNDNLKACPPNPEYKRERNRITYRYNKNEQGVILLLEQIKEIFRYIPPEDSVLMGFGKDVHPKRLIMNNLPVLPLCNRPTRPSNGQMEQDDLTKLYRSIVSANSEDKITKLEFTDDYINKLISFPEIKNPPTGQEMGHIGALHAEIGKLIFGPKTKEEHAKSIKKLLQGKKGLPRNEMMGKRGDYSARTVISPGPELEFGEIGIPISWASTLTYPVLVTSENRDALTRLKEAGKISKIHLNRKIGHQITITPSNRVSWLLEVGDTVERHMQDGDYVAINRNPSLHKYSILGYKVKLMEGLTIRLHIANTPGHNADFDGDEINLFLPRSAEAIAELQTVMNSRYCIINVQDNQSLTGLVFNDLTAAYKLTQDDIIVREKTWEDCMKIIRQGGSSQLDVINGKSFEDRLKMHNVKSRSGRALFSALLPETLYYQSGDVKITQGILIRGSISKKQAGTGHRSIAQFIFKNYRPGDDSTVYNYYAGAERAAKFLTDSQFVLKRWLEDDPITTSLADCYPKADPESDINQIYSIIHSTDKLILMDWDFSREILGNHSLYADFDTLKGRLVRNPIDNVRFSAQDEELPQSGYVLISSILPNDFNLTIDGQKVISEGILTKEIKEKDEATELRKSIIRELNFNPNYGSKRAFNFIKDIKTILVRCLGISLETGEYYELLHRELEKTKSYMEIYLPKMKDPIEGAQAKAILYTQLNNVSNIGETIIEKNLDQANNFVTIVNGAKTKGNSTNIGQIMGTLGPQFKGTELFTEGRNIYQAAGDLDPVGYGVVQSNFREGLGPSEFFHHAMASRVGLVDTSIKTAEPGTLSRQIVKSTEEILVQRDKTVKLQCRQIVQSVYGYTGLNPEKMINVTFPEGEIPFFIDIESVARNINGSYGHYS